MAKIKYAAGLIPLVKKHFGAVFQANHTNQTMKTDSAGGRTRWTNQTQRQQGLMKAIREWRNMPAETKTNWNTFAATYPQASRRNPAVFLTGYQLFLKRNHYCFLNHGIDCDFMQAPQLHDMPDPDITVTISASDNSIDVTELYIANFGIIPKVGQFVLIKIYPMAESSGHFFEPISKVIEVEEVFIDGFFVSLSFPNPNAGKTFSVYLSKVFYQSTNYVGTKVRYMGCFTPKTFLALTDTPDSYADEAGKIVTVKPDESGLEFTDPGAGGLTCEDLEDCPIIINILADIERISIFLVPEMQESVPVIHLGLLYNTYAFQNSAKISSSDDWDVLDYTDIEALIAWAGGTSSAAKFKETGLLYWGIVNVGATDIYNFHARGSGYRNKLGFFVAIEHDFRFWARKPLDPNDSYRYMIKGYWADWSKYQNEDYNHGLSIRLANKNTLLPEGAFGSYTGNDGKVYPTAVINGIEFITRNLTETLYRDLTPIPEITDNSLWVADKIGALCAYDNDWENV